MAIVIEILVLKGAFPSSVAVTFDLFTTANRLREINGRPPPFALRAIGSGARQARSFIGGRDAIGPPNILLVPGLGLDGAERISERLAERDTRTARQMLIAAAEKKVTIAAACSSVFLLASTGILDGRRATTTWWLAPLFRQLYPGVVLDADALVVRDGPFMTAGAAMAQLDLCLALVNRFAGAKLAEACARFLLLDQRRSQARYMALDYLTAADDRVRRAERWAREHLDKPLSVDGMAKAAGLGPRTFARRVERTTGHTPVQLLQGLRMERAIELIETTRMSFDEIAQRVGYADASALRRLLRKQNMGARALRSRQRTQDHRG
jgi:transcriptional regulator GlxA family with amidase domain